MFNISTINNQGFDKVILKDLLTGTVVEILPACGGALHGFYVVQNDQFLNVIDHYDDMHDYTNNLSSKGFKSCKLSPFACRLNNAAYTFAGQSYTTGRFFLNKSSLHGLLFDAPFIVTDKTEGEELASVTMKYEYNGKEPGYPFPYDCIITYQLKKNNELCITTEIINKDAGLIPMQDGWHPYFSFGGKINDLQLEFQSKEIVLTDADMIPTGETKPFQEFGSIKQIGETKLDHCFKVNFAECQPMCVLRDPAKKIQLEIYPDKSYPYLQIYTPDHRNSIAIENLSAAPDCFNNGMGLKILAPGEKGIFTTMYKIRTERR